LTKQSELYYGTSEAEMEKKPKTVREALQSSPVQRPGLKKTNNVKAHQQTAAGRCDHMVFKMEIQTLIRLFMKFRIRSFILDVIYIKKQ
jgi:hypothetical protein